MYSEIKRGLVGTVHHSTMHAIQVILARDHNSTMFMQMGFCSSVNMWKETLMELLIGIFLAENFLQKVGLELFRKTTLRVPVDVSKAICFISNSANYMNDNLHYRFSQVWLVLAT